MPKRTTAKPAQKKPQGEALVTSAGLMRATGYGSKVIVDLKAQGVIAPDSKGFWPAIATLGAMVRRLREKDAGNEDRQRKNKAEADSAESDALDKLGATVPTEAATLYVSEFRIATRQTIERDVNLTPTQKVKLLTKLAAIRIPPPKNAG